MQGQGSTSASASASAPASQSTTRRRLVSWLAAAGIAGLSGCTGVFRRDDPTGDPAVESDRPATNETFIAGPMEPYCDREGGDFPPMSEREYLVQSLPADREVRTVETFARRNLPGGDSVSLRADRPRNLGWRGQVYDIASRYNSERYFVGWVGEVGGNRALVVILHETYTELRLFETSPSC